MIFGEAAERLCGLAAQLLGWRPDEFWKATPAELATALQAQAHAGELLDWARVDALRRRFPD